MLCLLLYPVGGRCSFKRTDHFCHYWSNYFGICCQWCWKTPWTSFLVLCVLWFFHQFFSEQTFWSVFLDYVFIFRHNIFHLLFITHYCYQGISTSITRQRFKCLIYHGDGHVHYAATVLCRCKQFCNIFWNVALNLRNWFMSRIFLTI